jgi:hypothetical protein
MQEREVKSVNSDCTKLPTVAELWTEVEDDGAHTIPRGSNCTRKRKRFTR